MKVSMSLKTAATSGNLELNSVEIRDGLDEAPNDLELYPRGGYSRATT